MSGPPTGHDLLDLGGRVAVVTGAGQNVGRAIALRLAEHGAGAVVVNDLMQDRADAVAAEIETLGVKAIAVVADVGRHDDVQRMAEDVRNRVGVPAILVNNAGVPPDMPGGGREFAATEPSSWEPWIRVNLYGTMLCTRAFVPGMLDAGWGRVVSIISDAGRVGEPRMAAYAAAKAGIAGFTRAVAKEVGGRGITANCVALGGMRTVAMEQFLTPELEQRMLKRYVVKRLGTPADAANAVVFLASGAAEWVTGQVLPVNGGYSFAQ